MQNWLRLHENGLVEQGLDDLVAGEDGAGAVIGEGMAVAVADESTGLFHDQRTGRVVPGREDQLEEQLRASGGDGAEVERRRTAAADVQGFPEIGVGEAERLFVELFVVGRGAEHDDRIFEGF